MIMGSSTGSRKTSLEVFPGTPAPCTHPVYTQKQLFSILAHMPYCDLVRGRVPIKNTPKWTLKKTLLYELFLDQKFNCFLPWGLTVMSVSEWVNSLKYFSQMISCNSMKTHACSCLKHTGTPERVQNISRTIRLKLVTKLKKSWKSSFSWILRFSSISEISPQPPPPTDFTGSRNSSDEEATQNPSAKCF